MIWDLKNAEVLVSIFRHLCPEKHVFHLQIHFYVTYGSQIRKTCVKYKRVQKGFLINIPQHVKHHSHIQYDSHDTGDLSNDLIFDLSDYNCCRYNVDVSIDLTKGLILCNAETTNRIEETGAQVIVSCKTLFSLLRMVCFYG